MAKNTNNLLLHQLSGHLGKQIVIKRYGKKTILAKYPDMSKVKPSAKQKEKRKNFAKAVAYARSINNDPVKCAAYKKKLKKGQTVFHYAISEYLKKPEK